MEAFDTQLSGDRQHAESKYPPTRNDITRTIDSRGNLGGGKTVHGPCRTKELGFLNEKVVQEATKLRHFKKIQI